MWYNVQFNNGSLALTGCIATLPLPNQNMDFHMISLAPIHGGCAEHWFDSCRKEWLKNWYHVTQTPGTKLCLCVADTVRACVCGLCVYMYSLVPRLSQCGRGPTNFHCRKTAFPLWNLQSSNRIAASALLQRCYGV